MAWRRVPKSENAAKHKARWFENTDTGEKLPFRQYQQRIQHGGVRIEKQIQARRSQPGYLRSQQHQRFLKGMVTRSRNKEITELAKRYEISDSDADKKLIAKYIREHRKSRKFSEFTNAEEKRRFRDLFVQYPKDIVRVWLGSNEESRARRAAWDNQERAA